MNKSKDIICNSEHSTPSEEAGRGVEIKRFVTNAIGENCYLLWDDTLECAIIDCGAWGEQKEARIAQFIEENHLVPRLALQTHMHFDHIMGLSFLHRKYGLQPLCHIDEQRVYEAAPAMVSEWFGQQMPPLVPVGEYLVDEQTLQLGHTLIRVLHTPGHTPGGLCFYLPNEKMLFSGDTLFQGSVGRSDLPGGDVEKLIRGIWDKILFLPDDVTVYPGHGPTTTVGDERRTNPYLS